MEETKERETSSRIYRSREDRVLRVMGGSASPLLAWFVEQERLDADELDELRRLIDEAPPSKRRKR